MPDEKILGQSGGQQPTFPQVNVNVNEQGVIISLVLAPGVVLNHALGEEIMNEITRRWLETRRQVKRQMELAQNVMRAGHDDAKRQMELVQNVMRKN